MTPSLPSISTYGITPESVENHQSPMIIDDDGTKIIFSIDL